MDSYLLSDKLLTDVRIRKHMTDKMRLLFSIKSMHKYNLNVSRFEVINTEI